MCIKITSIYLATELALFGVWHVKPLSHLLFVKKKVLFFWLFSPLNQFEVDLGKNDVWS